MVEKKALLKKLYQDPKNRGNARQFYEKMRDQGYDFTLAEIIDFFKNSEVEQTWKKVDRKTIPEYFVKLLPRLLSNRYNAYGKEAE